MTPPRHTGDAAHDDSHPEGMTECDSLLNTRYSEEGQAERVENKPCVAKSFNPIVVTR